MKTINFTKSQLKELIREYYNGLGRNVEITINTESSEDFYGHSCACTVINLVESVSFGNITTESKTSLTKNDLNQILNSLLKEKDLEVTSINYLDGISIEEYFCSSSDRPYFNGIEVVIEEKGIKRNLTPKEYTIYGE